MNTLEEKINCVLWLAEFKCISAVRQKFTEHYGKAAPLDNFIATWINNFKQTGSVIENQQGLPISLSECERSKNNDMHVENIKREEFDEPASLEPTCILDLKTSDSSGSEDAQGEDELHMLPSSSEPILDIRTADISETEGTLDEEELGVLPAILEPILDLQTADNSETEECKPLECAIVDIAERKLSSKFMKKTVNCDVRNSESNDVSTLKKYLRYVHDKIGPFHCTYCETSFALKKDLKKHTDSVHCVRTHIETNDFNLKRFKCIYCSSSFTQRGNLNMHVNAVHYNIRPFNCDVCGFSFPTKNDLRKHIKSVHEKIKPHKCNQCEKAFANRTDLTRHIDTVHSNVKDYLCTECGAAFAMQRYLKRHFETVHLRQYKCFRCKIVFQRKTELKAHVKTPSHKETRLMK